MIKEKEIEIIVKKQTLADIYSLRLGRPVQKGKKIKIAPQLLLEGSHTKITGVCDICGEEKVMEYRVYFKITKGLTTQYQCQRHTIGRIKENIQQRYGVENSFQVEEYKEKSRQTSIKKYGVPYSSQREEFKQQYLYGENNYFYRQGGKPIDGKYENTSELKSWRQAIYEKYNYTCVICGKSRLNGDSIHAHHLWGYFDFPDKIYDEDNGIVLCTHHHREFHWLYQDQIITPDLFQEYVQGLTTISKESTAENELLSEVHRNPRG